MEIKGGKEGTRIFEKGEGTIVNISSKLHHMRGDIALPPE